MITAPQDLFSEAREKYSITDLWASFGYDGKPSASCRSPFREDRSPSFSVFNDGGAWCDHATGEGGDVIEFIKHAIGGDHKAVREWLRERIGGSRKSVVKVSTKPATEPQPVKVIQWPAAITEGTDTGLRLFANTRKISYSAAWVASQAGILRFCKLDDGPRCFVITDNARRAAEIRAFCGGTFHERKAYPLSGVDKSWLPGAELLHRASKETSILIVEGATDILTAIDICTKYRKAGGLHSWQPVALLGAGCKRLSPDCAELIRGRHVRLVPDADEAGDRMRDHWSTLLLELGCTVDAVRLPRGTDLTDNHSKIVPTDLFSK